MLFDLYNPWAKVCELGSTHPLTGKRIHALGQLAISRGQAPLLAFEQVDASGQALDKGRLYGAFLFEVTIHFLPYVFAVMFVILSLGCVGLERPALGALFGGLVVFGIGLGMTIRGFYRFPSLGSPAQTTVLDLMSDPYASPLRGRPVVLDGRVTGRASAGNKVGEDFMIADRSAGLMMINYESVLGFLGNFWFATRRVGKLMDQQVCVVGWFRRGMSQQVDLKSLRSQDGQQVSSWTGFWGKAGGIVVMILGLVLGGGLFAGAAQEGRESTQLPAVAPMMRPAADATAAEPVTAKPTVTRTPAAIPPAPPPAPPTAAAPAARPRAPQPTKPAPKPAAKPAASSGPRPTR